MPQGSTTFHESEDQLRPETRDMHRAIVSLMEELEAIDWYQQRIDATEDAELRAILEHNRDEEKEHAMMLLEWLRRHDEVFDRMMREHTGHEGPIVSEDETAHAAGEPGAEEGRGEPS